MTFRTCQLVNTWNANVHTHHPTQLWAFKHAWGIKIPRSVLRRLIYEYLYFFTEFVFKIVIFNIKTNDIFVVHQTFTTQFETTLFVIHATGCGHRRPLQQIRFSIHEEPNGFVSFSLWPAVWSLIATRENKSTQNNKVGANINIRYYICL